MTVPQVAEPQDDGDEMAESTDSPEVADGGGEMEETQEEPNISEVDLTEDDYAEDAASELFDGEESAGDTDDGDEGDDGDDSQSGLADLDGAAGQLEEAFNEGAAELATVQLPEDADRDDLRGEFVGVFQAFRLGHFASKAVDEYVLVSDGEEVDPLWGFFGAMLLCTAFVIWMRPDGGEKVEALKDAVSNIASGVGA